MSRSSRRLLVVLLGLVLVAGGFLWALPEIVRRVAQDRLARATGRPVTIADVDLHLFTGRLAVTGFRLADRGGPEPFVECDRLDVRVAPLDLFRSHVRVRALTLVNPSVRVVRLGPAEFNFSDLLPQPKDPPPPPSGPSRWTVTA